MGTSDYTLKLQKTFLSKKKNFRKHEKNSRAALIICGKILILWIFSIKYIGDETNIHRSFTNIYGADL